MANVIVEESSLNGIASAIRRKNGKSVNYLPSEMAGAIDQLVSYPEPTGTVEITENGSVDVKDKEFAEVDVSGGSATLISKTITANGEYDAEDDEADGYSDVTVNVPNSYVAADEGKVVSNGALVAQTSVTKTQNGTYDTTLNNEVVIDVSGGGGGIQTGTVPPTSDIGSDGDYYKQIFPVPTEANFVEYWQSSGTQYIDTGIYATQDTDVDVTYENVSSDQTVFGARTGSANSASKVLQGVAYTSSLRLNKSGSAISQDSYKINNLSGVVRAKTKTINTEDVYIYAVFASDSDSANAVSVKNTSGSFTADYTQILFGGHLDSTSVSKTKVRIYRITYFEANKPIADFLPCIDTNGVACMWDNVAGEYVYNDGTGDFAYGNTITPNELEPIIWVKENGAWRVVGS